ncbi:MAG TPA: CARDB domain-containing protein [Gaiellaceae bacterium]|nr:CARDB domain-containing protein [Gaiellaceae bacterium]
MSEHDTDIDFDFFEEEPPTEETSKPERDVRRQGPGGPPRPPRAPQNLTPLLRLIGLIAFAILIIVLLVFWIQSCQASSKSSTYKNYMAKIAELASSSQQIGRELSQDLLAPGVKRAQLEQQLSGLARQEQLNVNRAQAITPPGTLRDEHQAVIQALQYRVSGLTGLASALATTASSTAVSKAAPLLTAQMQRLLASDVIWEDSFKGPSDAELRRQGVTGTNAAGGPLVPGSTALQTDELASTSAMTSVLQRLKGASSAGTGCPCGTGLVSTKVEPSGKELTTSTQTTIVPTSDMAFQVTVMNTGKSQVFGVPVKLTIEQSKGGNITKSTKIDFLNPGESTTVTFKNIPIVNFSTPATIKVEVTPVAGETFTSNNSADYPVIFSVA